MAKIKKTFENRVGNTFGERREMMERNGGLQHRSHIPSRPAIEDGFRRDKKEEAKLLHAPNASFREGIRRFSGTAPHKHAAHERLEKGLRPGLDRADHARLTFLDQVIKLTTPTKTKKSSS